MKALSEGIFEGPGADSTIRARLSATAEREGRHALFEQLRQIDPVAAGRIHPNDLRRLIRALEVFELTGQPISSLQAQWDREPTRHECVFIGLRREREDQARRINERVRRMIAEGLVDEVKSLLAESEPLSTAARQALGYAEIIKHLEGSYSLADAVEMIKINTRQFAKAQRTWFKRFTPVEWIDLPAEPSGDCGPTIQRRGSLLPWPRRPTGPSTSSCKTYTRHPACAVNIQVSRVRFSVAGSNGRQTTR
jgi:tRNA dimethylallyltransferase